MNKEKIIILAGGASGGPVVPLLAIVQKWQQEDSSIRAVVVDVAGSAAEQLAVANKVPFKIISSGKFRRYWSLRNLWSPFQIIIGFIQSLVLLAKVRPVLVLGAGGFVQVPLIAAAFVLRIPRAIHQQDVLVTFSNRLVSPLANCITTTFQHSTKNFSQGSGLGTGYLKQNKVHWTGNPVRPSLNTLPTKHAARTALGFHEKLPVLMVVGGGTGSVAINEFITNHIPELIKIVQIFHITGVGKQDKKSTGDYHVVPFMNDMASAYAASDIVLARAGIGTLTELATLQKPSIVVPLPDTHQELNAELLYRNNAAVIIDQSELEADLVITKIRGILFSLELQQKLGKNLAKLFPSDAAQKIVQLLKKLV